MRLWVVRAGENLRYRDVFRDRSVVGIHFNWSKSSKDLLTAGRDELATEAAQLDPDLAPGAVPGVAGQLWVFAHELAIGDLVLTPGDRGHTFDLGRVTGDAARAPEGAPLSFTRSVDWTAMEVKASSLRSDLRNSLGGIQTVFAPRAAGAIERVQAVVGGEADPGPEGFAPADAAAAWVFQWNPDRYNLAERMARTSDDAWAMNQSRSKASVGARVWIRRTGADAGVVAVARITSLPRRSQDSEFGTWEVDIAYIASLDPPLSKTEIGADAILATNRAFTGAMGTNFPIDTATDLHLGEVVAPRLRPVTTISSESRRLGQAINRDIERHLELIEDEILAAVSHGTPDDFERLCLVLLEKLGYTDVVVTGARLQRTLGDHGVDLRARLSQPGMPALRVHIQAKRQKANVAPSEIQKLRGTLAPGDQAIFMTTSAFTARATDEAGASGLSPIGLLDGHAIARLMIELQIGVKAEAVALPRFDPDTLRAEIGAEPTG
jgi:restriction endonuclease Mrr